MPAIYIPRDLFSKFQGDAIDQQGQLAKESVAAAPPLDPPQPPTQPWAPPASTPSSTVLTPPAPPPLADVMATAGLTPPPDSAAAAPSPTPAAPADSGPPPLQDLLQRAGLGSVGAAVGQGASSIGTTAQNAAQNVASGAPPPLQDLMRTAGLLTPETATPAAAAPGGGFTTSPTGVGADTHQSQFGMGLSDQDAYAACGPAAAIGFARANGRNPTAQEAMQLAASVGWTSAQGMAGVSSEQALLQKMGVATKLEQGSALDWAHITKDALNGNPVVLDTPGHYLFVDSAKPGADGVMLYHIGTSGTDLRGGQAWETKAQLEGHSVTGQVRAALYTDNPNSPHPSVADTTSSTTQTTAGLSGGGDLAGRIGAAGQKILSGAADTASWLGDQGKKALQAVLVTEGGLGGARGDNGQSAGPLQFFEGGQLANYARQFGMTLEQAKQDVEQFPDKAIQWAIGTPDHPGYLGGAIQAGLAKGLQGPDLATFAQQHGQVSVSPERAGANFSALFGGGGGPVSTGTTAPSGTDWGAMTQKGIALGLQGQQLTDWINQQQSTTSPTAGPEAEATAGLARLRAAGDATIQSTRDQQEAAAASPAPIYHSAMIGAGGGGPGGTPPADNGGQSPLQQWGQQLTNSIVGLIQHIVPGAQQATTALGQAAQTAPPEGGGYGVAPAGGVNPLDALGQVKDQALYGPTGQPPTQQQMDTAYQGAGVALPSNPLEVAGSAAGEPTEGERLAEERNQAIAEGNPLRNVPFLGGATTMAAQTALDPTNLLLAGEPGVARAGVAAGKAGVEALGSDAAQAALRSRMPAQVEVGAALGMGPGEAGPTINGMTGAVAQRVMEARDAPVPPQALQDAQQTLDGLAGAGGRAVGAPPQAQTAEGLAQLRQQLTAMAQAGASQKDWYADSSKAILEATQGNPQDAEKLAQLVAIYSPNTPVSANMNNALTAWYQWRAGRPISVAMKAQDERASNLLYNGAQWEGRKTNNFYRNLMQYIDPQVYAQMGQEAGQSGVTADIWMMRAFGYPATEGALTSSGQPREFLKAPSARQYDFIQNEVTHVAQQLGWTPEQVQAAVWTAAKAGSEGSTVEGAGYHYGHAIGERTGQVSWEASPGATAIQDIPGYASGTFAQKQAFHDATAQAFLDEQGHDIVAQKYGLLGGNTFGAAGVYRGEVSPGAQTKFALPQAKQSVGGVPIPANVGRIQEDSRDAINAYAATRGLLLKQDAVPWTRIFKTPTLKTSNAAVVDIGRALTPEEAATLDGSLTRALGPDGHAVVSTEQGAWLLNLGDTPNASFQSHARNAVKALESVDEARVAPARYDSEYIANDWTAQPNGEGYRDIIGRSGRAEQFGQLEDTLAQRIRSAQEGAAAQNGWGPAATADTAAGNVGRAPAATTGGLLGRASDLLASPSTGGVVGGAQGAQISPALALDVAGAVGGGAAGNASAPEDASPAERAGRIALGAAGGGLLAHHLATSGLRQRGEGINPLGAGLPLRPPGQAVDALVSALSRYPEDVKQALREFVGQQTEAGQTGKAINDTLRQWVAENPLPEAAVAKPGLPPTGHELLGPPGPQPGQLPLGGGAPVVAPQPPLPTLPPAGAGGSPGAAGAQRGQLPLGSGSLSNDAQRALSVAGGDRQAAISVVQELANEARQTRSPGGVDHWQTVRDELSASDQRMLPVGGPRPTGTEALATGPQPGQLQMGSQLPIGGPRPPGGGPDLPTLPPGTGGQTPLPGVTAPTAIHPRIQQLLGASPQYAQIAQDGLNDLQTAKADPGTIARYFAGVERSAGLPSGVDANAWFRSLRNGAMAGGLQTLGHVLLNIPMQVLWSVPREAVAATLRGKPEQIPASVVGLVKGFSAGAEDALQELRYGISAESAAAGGRSFGATTAAKTALPPSIGLRTDNPALRTTANVLSGLVGTHGAAQTMVQKIGFYQKATELAWTQAKSEGLHGNAFSQRVGDILGNLTDPQWADLATEAQTYGDRMALRGVQGRVGSALQKVAAAGPAGNLLIPFEAIANKVLTGGVEATPGLGAAGLGMDLLAKTRGAGPYAAGATDVTRGAVTPISERAANQILGTGVFGIGLGLAAAGTIVGAGPSNPQERATALDRGDQFDGIHLGNTFVPGHSLGRLWYPLAAAANVYESQKYAKQGASPEEMMGDAIQRIGTFFGNETFMRQFGDAMAAIKDPTGKQLERFVAQQAESVIPQDAAMRDVGSAMDPISRVAPATGSFTADVGSRIAEQLPIVRNAEPPRITATTGAPTPNRSGVIGSFLHPPAPDDPIANEALRLEMAGLPVGLSQPKASYKGGQQTPEQLTTAQTAVGKAINLYATTVLTDPRYPGLTDTQKADALKAALSQAQSAANVTLGNQVARDPHESALMQWAQAPQYYGVKGTPEQIAEKNWEISQARSKLAAYKAQYKDAGEARLAKEDKAAYNLAISSEPVAKEELDVKKAAIDRATGGALSQTAQKAAAGGLVGVGSTTLPASPPQRP